MLNQTLNLESKLTHNLVKDFDRLFNVAEKNVIENTLNTDNFKKPTHSKEEKQ